MIQVQKNPEPRKNPIVWWKETVGVNMSTLVRKTGKFSVMDAAGAPEINHMVRFRENFPRAYSSNGGGEEEEKADQGGASASGSRVKTRANVERGSRQSEDSGKIGGAFAISTTPGYIQERIDVFDRLKAVRDAHEAGLERRPLRVTLPDGAVKEGTTWETTPYDIARDISQGLADSSCVAKVRYTGEKVDGGEGVVTDAVEDDMADAADHSEDLCCGGADHWELWDLTRPLIGDCDIEFCKFDSPEGQTTFWHSSAHVLGEALEQTYGCHLTIGPPLANGFFYDSYMGEHVVPESDYTKIDKAVQKIGKQKQKFERLVLTKAEALEMFRQNPFKTRIITTKVPDDSYTSVYRCGPLIDLCCGPHLPHTGKVKAFKTYMNSAAYWLGKDTNDSLQRVYGVSFPDKKRLKKWEENMAAAKERDHRKLGKEQELFFFHDLSPGSCFFLPRGATLYNKLMDFIRDEYWQRGYQEVITPNMFNFDLWHTSGHAKHYKDDMFVFKVENQEFGLKPMNCPSHCLMFASRNRSWRELPMRLADFGVLHRNERSGALTGLTRVRRFQQDDAHIFCMPEQIREEVLGALDFMKTVYDIFGMTYKLELSTRPEKALGEQELWDTAEDALRGALNEFAGEGNWRVNAGDGTFYGPKIDIKVYDALERVHQCATVQLDFQLPIRFKLRYRRGGVEGEEEEKQDAGGKKKGGGKKGKKQQQEEEEEEEVEEVDGQLPPNFERPIIVHRAMLGSVERMIAILTEHFGGLWPFWLSPRQAIVIPVGMAFLDYAKEVSAFLRAKGQFLVDVDESTKTLNNKIRMAMRAKYNYVLVVGETEMTNRSVKVRMRGERQDRSENTLEEIAQEFQENCEQHR